MQLCVDRKLGAIIKLGQPEVSRNKEANPAHIYLPSAFVFAATLVTKNLVWSPISTTFGLIMFEEVYMKY